MSNSVTELKHCPFCGNTPRLVDPHESERSIEGETDNEEWLSFVECDCVDMFFVKGSATSQEEAKKSVVEAWNNRAADRTGPPLNRKVTLTAVLSARFPLMSGNHLGAIATSSAIGMRASAT